MLKLVTLIIFILPISLNFLTLSLSLIMIFMFLLINMKFSFFVNMHNFFLLDNMSLGLVFLSIFMSFLLNLSMNYMKMKKNYVYLLVLISALNILLILSFTVSSLFMFYIFFEASLIPIYLIIMGWGYQPERLSASFYMFIYTIFSSLPLMIFIFYCYKKFSFSFFFMYSFLDLVFNMTNLFIWISMTFAFMVKLPLFTFHIWLPKAHVEAPVGGSMILAGILLKLGIYGVYRILFFLSNLSLYFNMFYFSLSLCGGLMASFICLYQLDLKVLIAYSSVAHMGMSMCSILTLSDYGMMGAYSMALAHGFCSSGLFFLSYCNYKRTSSRSFFMNKGFLNSTPFMVLFWFLFCTINMSSPPFLSIFSEICMIISIMSFSWIMVFILFMMLFFSCAYSLYLFSLISHGKKNIYNIFYGEGTMMEFLILILHFLPTIFLILFMECSLSIF